jgi:hypothetical protein
MVATVGSGYFAELRDVPQAVVKKLKKECA